MFESGGNHDETVLPLVLCASAGGPHDDEAFTSGWRLGAIAATLAHPGFNALSDSIRPDERLQADLLAMACGYSMTIEPGTEEWLSVTFRRVDDHIDADAGLGAVRR